MSYPKTFTPPIDAIHSGKAAAQNHFAKADAEDEDSIELLDITERSDAALRTMLADYDPVVRRRARIEMNRRDRR